jgi:phosphoglycerate dehydrogenase-like enzyme
VDELFAEADILSVHIDGRADNYHYVDGKLLSRMKPDAIFINTSRGVVVDAAALAAAMRDRPEGRAMIDVHETEPFESDYPLLGRANVTLLPHLASRTDKGLINMSWVVRDIAAVLEGRKPEFAAP